MWPRSLLLRGLEVSIFSGVQSYVDVKLVALDFMNHMVAELAHFKSITLTKDSHFLIILTVPAEISTYEIHNTFRVHHSEHLHSCLTSLHIKCLLDCQSKSGIGISCRVMVVVVTNKVANL